MTKRKRQKQERPKNRSCFETIRQRLADNRDIVQAVLLFIVVTLVGFSLVLADWSSGHILDPLNDWTASASGYVINLLGGDVDVSANCLWTDYGSVTVAEGCNTVYITILFLAAIIAFPTSWRKRLVGILLGPLGLFIVNILRVITLLYLNDYDTELFEIAHLYLWQFAIILSGGLLWLAWIDKIVQRPVHARSL
jgi:exosortase H (IPTLxxWG-CTERM-specific)